MNSIKRDMMKCLVNILNEASDCYYNTGHPILTDEQFDTRLEDLKKLEEETGFVYANSPTQRVGYRVLTELNEVTHTSPMLSLDKCHSIEELLKFINNRETVASIKLDGLTLRLTYDNGNLVRAETRGDGMVGSDVTEHAKHFLNIPMKICKEGTYTIDGEAIIFDKDFAEINKNGEYKNSRNLASGTLAVLDTSLVTKRRLRFYGWNVVEGGGNSLKNNLNDARESGFDIVPFWFVSNSSNALNTKNLQSNIDYIFEYAKDNGFPCDGVVFKFDDIEYGNSLGATNHHFRSGTAYKRKDETYRTKLLDIEWSCGKSGTITPVAIFEPVDIDGVSVSRSTIYNVSILTKMDLHIGDTIEVCRANSVRPDIKRNVSADERKILGKEPDYMTYPEHCPVCGDETRLIVRDGSTVLTCTNEFCKGKLLAKLTHFCSKGAMNIDGLSDKKLEKFINLEWLSCFEDIYNLKYHFSEMIELEGFGVTSVKKLLNAIAESKNTTLDRFIYALSIPMIGSVASKTISKYFNGDFDRFCKECCLDTFDFTVLDDFGEAMNESINDYINKNVVMIGNLAKEMNFEKPQIVSGSNVLDDKIFVITGSLTHFTNRDEAKAWIERFGGKVSGSVSAKTSFLVNNDVNSTSGKNKKAIELGIPIISEDELIKMIN